MVADAFRVKVDSKSSITFDGWSNSRIQSFYAVTIYFFADGKAQDALLDFSAIHLVVRFQRDVLHIYLEF
jgi:hypothetical protein